MPCGGSWLVCSLWVPWINVCVALLHFYMPQIILFSHQFDNFFKVYDIRLICTYIIEDSSHMCEVIWTY